MYPSFCSIGTLPMQNDPVFLAGWVTNSMETDIKQEDMRALFLGVDVSEQEGKS